MAGTLITTDEQKQAWVTAARAGKADKEAVQTSLGATASAGPQTRDTVAKFLAGAPEEVRELAMEAVGDPATSDRPTVAYVISDPTQDSHGDVVTPAGWVLDEYRTNNVLLWSHDTRTPAIGNGLGTHVDGERLLSVGHFAPRDLSPLGYTVGKLAEARIIQACSVGFVGLEWLFDEALGDWGVRWLKQKLKEWSPCNLGSNPNALVDQARALDIDTAPLLGLFQRALDGEQLLSIAQPELAAWWKALRKDATFSVGALKATFEEERATMKAKWLEEQAKRVAAERAQAQADGDEPVTDWRAVAAALGATRPADLKRAIRAHTFAALEGEAIAASREKSREAVEAALAPADQGPAPAPEAPSQVDPGDPPSAGPQAVTVDEARAILESLSRSPR